MELDKDLVVEDDTQKNKYLTFEIDNKVYAILIKHVTEIIKIQKITDVPDLPEYIKGIINLRGKIIPVMDVRLRFGKEPIEYNDSTCIIVIDIDDISLGLIVDNVSEVLKISKEKIVIPPDMNKKSEDKYVKAIAKINESVKFILNSKKLISDKNVDSLLKVE